MFLRGDVFSQKLFLKLLILHPRMSYNGDNRERLSMVLLLSDILGIDIPEANEVAQYICDMLPHWRKNYQTLEMYEDSQSQRQVHRNFSCLNTIC